MGDALDQQIAHQLKLQRERLAEAARAAGRAPEDVRLIAVTKKQPVEKIVAAYRAGQRDFGENYVQELVRKAEQLSQYPDIRWHFIGHLQSNKAKYLAPFVHAVHTVSSPKLAKELGARVMQRRRMASFDSGSSVSADTSSPDAGPLSVLLEVNVSGESTKSGCRPEELEQVLEAVESQPGLRLAGLMTLPPQTEDPELARPHFEALRKLQQSHGGAERILELSMGMSRDAAVAVACGSTCVRIGTAIFGERET